MGGRGKVGGTGIAFVFTNPDPNTIMIPTDRLYVFASEVRVRVRVKVRVKVRIRIPTDRLCVFASEATRLALTPNASHS